MAYLSGGKNHFFDVFILPRHYKGGNAAKTKPTFD